MEADNSGGSIRTTNGRIRIIAFDFTFYFSDAESSLIDSMILRISARFPVFSSCRLPALIKNTFPRGTTQSPIVLDISGHR